MVNTVEFSKRLERIIAHYGHTAASFAASIDVNRSSISHLLSGRNKPSLDFVIKIIDAYPEVELYWLLNGKGTFPSIGTDKKEIKTTPIEPTPQLEETSPTAPKVAASGTTAKDIERIVIFYKDGTFSTFSGK